MPRPTHYTYPTAPPSLLVALRDFLAQKVFSTAPHEEERGDRSVKVFGDGSILYDDSSNRKMLRNVRPALATKAAATAHADQLREKIASIQLSEKLMNELLGGAALLPDGLRHDITQKQYEPDGAWYWNVRYALWLRPAQGEVPVPVLGAGLEFDLSPGGQVLRMHNTTLPVMKPRKVEGFKMLDTTGPPSPPPTEGDKAQVEDPSNSIIFLRNERGYVAHHVSKEKGYVPANADGVDTSLLNSRFSSSRSKSTEDYTLPDSFNPGKEGRVVFDKKQKLIKVYIHICFYGAGFPSLQSSLMVGKQNDLVESSVLRDWLSSRAKYYRNIIVNGSTDDIKKAESFFYKEIIDKECTHIQGILNEIPHMTEGPDKENYCVDYEVNGIYLGDEEVKSAMNENRKKVFAKKKKANNGDPNDPPINEMEPAFMAANNALFFIGLFPLDFSPHNSERNSLYGKDQLSMDNSIAISTLDLHTTRPVHEIVAHGFWGRGSGSAGHINTWQDNLNLCVGLPEIYPSIRMIERNIGPNNENYLENQEIPFEFKDPLTGTLNIKLRKVLPLDKIIIGLSVNLYGEEAMEWGKNPNYPDNLWWGDATNTFYYFDKIKNKLIQRDLLHGNDEDEREFVRKVLWEIPKTK